MQLDRWLTRSALRHPDRVALETPDARMTYRELLLAGTRAAARLLDRGAYPGDRVAIALPPGQPFVVALHGCLLLRAPAMPIDVRLSAGERAELLRGGVEVLVSQPLAESGGAPFDVSDPDERELALIVHTSGTTRTPRPVELTFGSLAAHVRAVGAVLGTDPDLSLIHI